MTPHHASVLRDAISTSSMAPQDERNPKHSPSLRRNRQRRAMLIRPALAARGKPVAESAADDVAGRGEDQAERRHPDHLEAPRGAERLEQVRPFAGTHPPRHRAEAARKRKNIVHAKRVSPSVD